MLIALALWASTVITTPNAVYLPAVITVHEDVGCVQGRAFIDTDDDNQDDEGTGLANAEIRVCRGTSSVCQTTTTDAEGFYHVHAIGVGWFQVRVMPEKDSGITSHEFRVDVLETERYVTDVPVHMIEKQGD